jgi:histidyl-tRNA synthetase
MNYNKEGFKMSGLAGFAERFGFEMEISDYVSRVLRDTGRHLGYRQIGIPMIEKASSYSEKVVGSSPWPGWERRGCFFFDIQNYSSSYEEDPITEHVLLIPEGTLSVTRWLGEKLGQGAIAFPIKMFYDLMCYRNELIYTLSQTKHREFTQFGLEILGSKNPHSDIEILCAAV